MSMTNNTVSLTQSQRKKKKSKAKCIKHACVEAQVERGVLWLTLV